MIRSPRPQSLTRRLLAATLTLMTLVLIITAVVVERAYTSSLLKAEQDRLKAHFFALLGALEWQDNGLDMGDRLKEPGFWQFRSGLYAEIASEKGETLWQSVSADTLALPQLFSRPAPGVARFSELRIADEPFFAYRYQAIWETDEGKEIPLLFSIYSAQDPLLQERRQFRTELAGWLSLALALSLLVSALTLYRGLRPLRDMAAEIAALDQGKSLALQRQYPRELDAVAQSLNHLLEKEQKQRERYRNTLSDLAHSLKTPLAVLKSSNLDADSRDEQIARMDNIISYQLKRAVTAGERNASSRTPVQPLITRLCDTLQKVYAERERRVHSEIDPGIYLRVDEQDLLELFGNLLDNAFKACRSAVLISANAEGDSIDVIVADDGPGFADDRISVLQQRGMRGDQYGPGQGLGLSIVGDIVASYGGQIVFGNSENGGASITVSLPGGLSRD